MFDNIFCNDGQKGFRFNKKASVIKFGSLCNLVHFNGNKKVGNEINDQLLSAISAK